MSAITTLTPGGIREICEAANPAIELRDIFYVVQCIEVKVFTQMDNKKNIKARYVLA
jgi:hypothetical protein